ncbi:hypothetical protein C8E87_7854 [Paractinoplanes brasiliensis]|uniref:Uncharacterized protein n=1 Tax=Paractinoplanes brasiliensis TaxID=52695 RepID=A0A4R6JAW3_9ACTN|nr:hypothetical protein C8E87_7854 [Actinoplanes brasiliensis]GID27735.1 hypothetical protein Abr02nite_27180 [Actinoplanes brasiliensis]
MGNRFPMDEGFYARRPKQRDLRMHITAALTILRASDSARPLSGTEYIATADVLPVEDCVVDAFVHVRANGKPRALIVSALLHAAP